MAVVAERYVDLKKQGCLSPLQTALRNSAWAGVFTIGGVVALVIVSWVTATAFAVYYDHQLLANRNRDLVNAAKLKDTSVVKDKSALEQQIEELQGQLEFRKRNLVWSDPVSNNIMQVFQAFSDLRMNIGKGTPCFVKVTAPPDSLEIAREVSQLAHAASKCQIEGFYEFRGDSAVEKEALDGALDGFVIVHAPKDSMVVWQSISTLDLGLRTKPNYNPKDSRENFMWLQFGHKARWNN